jgi:hypothetical protein
VGKKQSFLFCCCLFFVRGGVGDVRAYWHLSPWLHFPFSAQKWQMLALKCCFFVAIVARSYTKEARPLPLPKEGRAQKISLSRPSPPLWFVRDAWSLVPCSVFAAVSCRVVLRVPSARVRPPFNETSSYQITTPFQLEFRVGFRQDSSVG